jgi:DNA repair exonuclease SbcCD ATPase subunit
MKIVELHAENVKRLRVVDITPTSNVVIVGGKNGAGKSTVLDCIRMAFSGAKGVDAVPVRTGQTAAKIIVDTGELKIERRFSTATGTQLIVTGADGKRIASPQTVLDKLYSSVAFDPLEFARAKPAEQAATLRRIVGLDFSALDAERARIYQEREACGRLVAQAKARLAAMPEPAVDVPAEEVSVAELMAQKEAADGINLDHAQVRRRYDQARTRTEEQARAVEDLKKRLSVAEDLYAGLKATENSAQDDVVALADDIDTASIVEKIKGAATVNRAIQEKAARARESVQYEALRTQYTSATKAIEAIDTEKESKLTSAKWPIEGLGFSPNGVTYKGLPFEQASESERVRVSVSIGCEQNPELAVMLIKEGCQLDDDSMAEVCRMAGEKDAMVWIERVGTKDQGAVILEDGEVKPTTETKEG